ncbi:FtsB family cell division protein [Haloimpatiens sp. FM7315]|uniref:FtsB family cell division protein n=1 Tax=Haloimpatiens sp. FM7315 TaxID=3298609 RepID=UPI00370BB038
MRNKLNAKNVLFCFLVLYVIYIFANQQIVIARIKAEKNSKEKELTEMRQKNKELQDKVQMSKSDSYIERLAREKLNFIKKGETPVINNFSKKSQNN